MTREATLQADQEYLEFLAWEQDEYHAQQAELAAERRFEASLEYDAEAQDEMYEDDARLGGTFSELMRG